ncbi:Thioredoxin reductase [Pseudoclavibacter triregionum]|nr:Thioredoxin reductase [Pseudoclavibacter triregionum]
MRNVVIIGSGPAGFTAAVYAARAGLRPVVIASSVEIGGELMNTTDVENFPGFPEGILGPELMQKMQEQAERFGAEIVYDDVTAVELSGEVKRVTTAYSGDVEALAVIVSTGSAYRKLGLEGEQRLSGRGVSWCATCDGAFFKDQHIAVVGGGDSAMEEATFLTRFASKVTLIHRSRNLRASKIMRERAEANEKIEFLLDTTVEDVLGEQKVEGLRVRNAVTGETSELPVTGLFVAIGNDPRIDLVKDQLEIAPEGTIKVEGRSSKTSLPGVFAAGDVIDPSYRQAITAAGSGCVAALDAEHFLASLPEELRAKVEGEEAIEGDPRPDEAPQPTIA